MKLKILIKLYDVELISLYKNGALSIFTKFLVDWDQKRKFWFSRTMILD